MRAGQAARYRNFQSERTQHEVEWPTTVSPGDATLRSALSGMPNSHLYLAGDSRTPGVRWRGL
jgi:hypothetical protein